MQKKTDKQSKRNKEAGKTFILDKDEENGERNWILTKKKNMNK